MKPGDAAFKGLNIYSVKGESSAVYKYIYGKFSTAEQARASLTTVRKKFPEAFVVEVKGNDVKRVK